MFDYPLVLNPIAVPRPWGGGRLPDLYGRRKVDASEPIGESWEVSTWPQDPGNPELATVTTIANGPLAGTPLDQVCQVPVVVKLLDSAERLSIQVHPVSDQMHKDEMWYVLYAEPGAYLYCGLKPGVSGEDLCSLLRNNQTRESEIIDCLNTLTSISPGTHLNVPSGTVHAVGPGLVAFEVSECMQVTYRLYDYNRGRALHIDEGCAALSGNRATLPLLEPSLELSAEANSALITQFPTFAVTKVCAERFSVEESSHVHLLTPVNGHCTITGPDPKWNMRIERASTCLIPSGRNNYQVYAGFAGEVLITSLAD